MITSVLQWVLDPDGLLGAAYLAELAPVDPQERLQPLPRSRGIAAVRAMWAGIDLALDPEITAVALSPEVAGWWASVHVSDERYLRHQQSI